MTATLDPWRQVLFDAADLIERDGATRLPTAHMVVISLRDQGLDDLADWITAPERTAEEVIAKLREVASS